MSSHPIDSAQYPNLAANEKAKSLLEACFNGFQYGMANAATMKDAPEPTGWNFEQTELVKACTYSGQFAGNATTTKNWNAGQQEYYQQDYGAAVAKGFEDMLAKRPAQTAYTPAHTWDQDVKDTLQTIYVTAYYSNQNATMVTGNMDEDNGSGSSMSSGTKTALIVAGVGVVGAGLVMAGLHYFGKKPLANPFGARYRVDDDPETFSLESFLANNQDLDAEAVSEIKKMSAGMSLTFGGGAQPRWTITRVR